MKPRLSLAQVSNLLKWLCKQWTIVDWGLLITLIALAITAIAFYIQLVDRDRQVRENQQTSQNHKMIIQSQIEILELLRTNGNRQVDEVMAPIYQHFKEPEVVSSGIYLSVSQITDRAPARMIVSGFLGEGPRSGTRWWLGTQNGLHVWPQVEFPKITVVRETFEYSISDRSGLRSGAVVLLEVGDQTQTLFSNYVVEKREDGLFLPHLRDVRIRATINYQLK